MERLSDAVAGKSYTIEKIRGEDSFLRRITSIGLTPGCKIKVLKNEKNRPLLIYNRDSMIALNKANCENIRIGKVKNEQ